MKKLVLLILFSITICCKKNNEKDLIFLGKNAYEYPVWEEMLLLDKVKFSDIVVAFKAYKSNNILDKETIEHFEKLEKRIKPTLDSEGYYISKQAQYQNLLAYRKAKPNGNASQTIYGKSASFVSAEIPNKDSYGRWKNLGPFGDPEVRWSATGNGAMQYIKMHPTNPAIMYACSRNGGLWKTINYGKNWTPETDYFATNNTSCIEICPKNPAILYLGAAEDQKIWYSSDEGKSWEDRSTGISGTIYDIHSDPIDDTRAIAATSNGIYITQNAGMNWTLKLSGRYTDIDLTDNWDLIVVANDHNDLAPVIHFSKDKGDSFIAQQVTTELNEVDKFYVGIHKPTSGTGPTQVFAYGLVNGNTPTLFVGLWKSDYIPTPTNGASHFNFARIQHPTYAYPNGPTPLTAADNDDGFKAETSDYYGSVNPNTTSTWIGDFYVSPNDPNKLLTLREKFWGSRDGGIIWEFKPSYGGSNWADNRYVTTNVAKDSVFWCNDGGMWAIKESDLFPTEAILTAAGLSESAYMASKVVGKNGDICVIEGSQMDVSQMNKGVFITGGQDIGQIFTRNGRDSHVASADVYRGRIKPTNDKQFITGGLKVQLEGETGTFEVYNHIEPDHFNANRLYGFTKGTTRLVRSPDGQDGWLVNGFRGEDRANAGGHSWTPTHNTWEIVAIESSGITNLRAGTFEQSRANAELAFLGDEQGGKLFYTENLSADAPTWIQLPNAPKVSRYRIATHQYNENIIVVASNSGVYISKDKGQSWAARGAFPGNNPAAVLMDRNTSEGIYVMTGLTVYYIDENLTEWVEFNQGLPLQNLSDMRIAYYPNNDNRLYVSKYGRGVWASNLQSTLTEIQNKPIADFSIHGGSSNEILIGEKVQLLNQSSNSTELAWTIENGNDVFNISNENSPKLTLTTPGYYKVTLTATNAEGSDTAIKEQFIYVKPTPITPNCKIEYTREITWFKRFRVIRMDEDTFNTSSNADYISSQKEFKIRRGETVDVYMKNNWYQDTKYFYTKAWIDYNNDGVFNENTEEVVDSKGIAGEFTTTFTVSKDAELNKPLLMRIVALESDTAPIPCQKTGYKQIIDLFVQVVPSVNFESSHSNVTSNSAQLQTNYTGTTHPTSAGFVYAKFDGELTVHNAEVITHNGTLNNDDNYTSLVTDLAYNATYYYRPFVRDAYGIYYGNKQQFQLAPYKMPLAEGVIATNLGNNQWKLKGLVIPEGALLDEVSIEYGEDHFNNSIAFNPNSYDMNTSFNITTEINTVLGSAYQFRVKMVEGDKTYYSNSIKFDTNQTICTPVISNSPWYKRIRNVTFDGHSNNSSGSAGYEDFTDIVFDTKKDQTYTISVTDSYAPGYNLSYLVYIDYNNDGDFNDYHEVAAQGTPNAETFTTTITIPSEDVVYNTNLRMRVMGYNGSANQCSIGTGQIEDYTINIAAPVSTLALEKHEDNTTLKVFPNPVDATLFLSTENLEGNTLEIFNNKGKSMHTSKVFTTSPTKQIDVSQLTPGIYILKARKDKKEKSIKFIKR
ncbi:GEVED domain-containing protein [Tenacibaculum maritimum]|uniref:GEVED domain-containing protein n=1 Tax=Tenacibaculum maritimum TaxID=107401 RepID=UPI00387691F8